MKVRYASKLQAWVCEGQIADRQVVVLSQSIARCMALYRLVELSGVPEQDVYLDYPPTITHKT